MTRSKQRMIWISLAMAMLVLMTGCSTMNPQTNPIDPETAGFFTKYFVYPLSEALDFFADLLWNEYGLAILVVTIIIRLIVLPLNLKQYKSSKKMQAIQPEMLKLREKYKDNPQKMQEEMMKLYQLHGVNPLAGCLPILVQMPILIALYSAIMRNESIYTHDFLWLQLGTPDPYYILPAIAALTTFIQQKQMSAQMTAQMRSLMFIFPVLIFAMSMSFASALPLYWIYGNLFTIVQNYFLYGGSKKEGAKPNEEKSRGKQRKNA
ncbi:YidC family membrane integrase SpoIIIJ [Paenibacillus thermoaerophilus]